MRIRLHKARMMQNQNSIKPTILASFSVWIIIALDGFTTLVFALLCLLLAAISEPADLSHVGPHTKDAIYLWAGSTTLLAFAYLVACFISLVCWQQGRRNWGYIILGLGLIHLVGSACLLYFRSDFDFTLELLKMFLGSFVMNWLDLFCGSLVINLILLIIIINERIGPKSLFLKSQA